VASVVIWLVAVGLEGVSLLRSLEGNFVRHYKLFYVYLGFVLLRDLCLLGVYFFLPGFYPKAYWGSEPLGVVLGCALVWEVYDLALARYRGTGRVARSVLALLLIATMTRILVKAWDSPNWIPGRSLFEIERDLRIVQAALLLGLLALFSYYKIRLGRNLKGITYGYALFLASSLVNLSLREYLGNGFEHVWEYIQPGCYLLVLLLWCVTLWSYAPVPEPELEPRLETDYQSLLRATRGKLGSARIRLMRVMRP
jgi:hypothetical protein